MTETLPKPGKRGLPGPKGHGEKGIVPALGALSKGQDIAVPDGAAQGSAGAAWQGLALLIDARAQAASFARILEILPYSVLLCTPDLEIRFANKASRDMIARLSAHVPAGSAQLVGQSLALFEPRADRKLKPAAEKHGRCVIQLGAEWVEFRFKPVEAAGLPPQMLVTWNIVTERVDFASTLKAQLDGVTDAAIDLEASGKAMSATVDRAAGCASEVAAVSVQATGNVTHASSAAEELAQSVKEIGRQVEHSTEVAARAVAQAETTNTTIQSLAEAANKIGQVVQLISDIAGQTNLLALNATIEAARAGEAGKGFAVVASEVKALANQTAKATGEIGTQISAIQDVMKNAVGAIGAIRSIIDEISAISSSISVAVDEQTTATHSIATNISEAVTGTTQVGQNIGAVAQAVNETTEAASDMLDAVKTLTTNARPMRAHIESYLKKISA